MAWYDGIMDNLAQRVAWYMTDARKEELARRGAYYAGDQRKNIKVTPGRFDDNVILNFTGLAIDRAVSRLVRGGVEFALPEGAEAQQELIDDTWRINHQMPLMLQLGINGAVFGTAYAKLIPDGIADPVRGTVVTRIVPLDPELMTITCDPMDKDKVLAYVIEWKDGDNAYRQVTRLAAEDDEVTEGTWVIEDYEAKGTGTWILVNKQQFPYDFPPIVHWKNLPAIHGVYGSSDIDDTNELQDKANFVYSNIAKIIRLQAHRQRYGVGFSAFQSLDFGPDKLPVIPGNGEIRELDAAADLASSVTFAQIMRQALFDVAREVDISSITDQVGALTNFGLRVLHGDALDKVDTKRHLYGDAYLEINRRILVMAGYEGEASDPGAIIWHDPLPVNSAEVATETVTLLQAGIISKATAAERLGIDWEQEQERMSAEQVAGDNVGAAILRAFTGGQ